MKEKNYQMSLRLEVMRTLPNSVSPILGPTLTISDTADHPSLAVPGWVGVSGSSPSPTISDVGMAAGPVPSCKVHVDLDKKSEIK